MPRCRVVPPDTVTIPISDGDWIEVKKRLSYGDAKKAQTSAYKDLSADGERLLPDYSIVEIALTIVYLVNWSLMDRAGKVITIDGQNLSRTRSALEQQDVDTVKEIVAAVNKHIDAMDVELEAEKNAPAIESASPTTSSSAA